MADKQKEMELGPFSADERQYFESRGEKEIPPPAADTPPPAPAVDGATPAAAAPGAAPEAKAEPEKTVPQGALHEERKRRQAAEDRSRELELMNARMEERFRAWQEVTRPQPQPQPQPPPSVDRDIFGAVKHMQNEQTRTRQEIDAYRRQIQAEDQIKQLKQWGAGTEAEFVKDNPDYYQALGHLRAARGRDLAVWGMPAAQIATQLIQEENQLLARAAAERRSPAQMVYDLARERGYQKAAPAAQQSDGKLPPVSVDLNRIQAGQQQASSLSNMGGGSGRDVGDVEVEDLLKMSDKEFGAFIEKHPGRFRRLKGAAH